MTPGRVVVGGEALVDLVPAGDGTYAAREGGVPYNVALSLARLGVPTAFLSRTSTDAFGERLLARLAPYQRVVFVSGDVHYSCCVRLDYWRYDQTAPTAPPTTSSTSTMNTPTCPASSTRASWSPPPATPAAVSPRSPKRSVCSCPLVSA